MSVDVSDECSEISLCAATESTRGTSEKLLPAPKTFLITSLKSYLAQSTFTLFKKYYLISPHTPSTAMLLLISRNRVRGHCVDEIHTVVSAFHAATELDPQLHTRFALQTISYLYKNLRERIGKKILMMGSGFRERQREVSRRLNLPPALPSSAAKTYPKDSEKHLLAIRSGLTRSQIHTVVSAFHAATELDPQLHTRFALQTISYLYKNLRERIGKKILMMGSGFRERQREVSRRLNLPPALPSSAAKTYPKDSEKHLLAIRSGLTRSQVSNWFINARVRLWKPMIEDMYAEMNKRKLNNTHLQGGNGGSIIRVPKSVMMSQESDKIRE
ncbi:hypothetical protein F2Q69_00032973 [Brassica cretica]|uniref:Homeobox domain-containing protein n=1 Tax=Brassica cretica TaxID=69181 RepID=A0A8S9SJD0_BRACR|nr:hypothetical protein F2Q69_00032973 [Brassica cretica]